MNKLTQNRFQSTTKTAVLLMNMGGPTSLDNVHPYLLNLFSDSDLIPLPFQKYLGPLIAKRRTPKIIEQYSRIGGKSPIGYWTKIQGDKLTKLLDQTSPSTAPHKPYVAFRYADPLTDDTVIQMKKDKIDRAVVLSLYPQYSCSTTGSSLNELYRSLKVHDPEKSIKLSVIDRWSTNQLLAKSFSKRIQHKLETYPETERDKVIILFSAHSLPMSVVNRGDPYPAEVAATVSKVMEDLRHSNPYRLVWQSKVGPLPWLGPQTEFSLVEYGKKGFKNILIVPIAFVSDHVETLFEIDIEYKEVAHKHGITGFKRVESLNDDDTFISAMADEFKNHIHLGKSCSNQMKLRCPGCTNVKCQPTKDFFS